MTNLEFIEKLKLALSCKTLYVNGAIGAPAGYGSNRTKYINGWSKNKTADRMNAILHCSDNTFFFDCICLGKAILWGWDADEKRAYGGATYLSNNVPDFAISALPSLCTKSDELLPTTPLASLQPATWLWNDHHVGYYIGNGSVIECSYGTSHGVTYDEDGVQLTELNKSKFSHYGQLKFIDYIEPAPKPTQTTIQCPCCGATLQVELKG